MGEYDITTGHLFRHFPEDLVKFTAGDTAKNIKLADPVLKQVRYADATAHATIQGSDGTETEVIVHIEFQTDTDDTMPIRMTGYIGQLLDMYRKPIHATVIYLRPQEIDDPGIYQHTFPNKFIATYNVFKIWEFDGEKILKKHILGLLPFTPLMSPEGVSEHEWIGKCVKTIEESVPNEQDRRDLLTSTSILAGLVHDINFVQNFIPEEIMRQSSVVQEIIRKERAQAIIKNIEFRIGTLDEYLKSRILAIQDEALLDHFHRQSVLADKAEIEKEIVALSA